ncbi:MAG: hypothetical protein MUE97_00700 [Phycisphaerales bacterium]|jgi:UDP-N-acetylglucosamine diphosphorylase/glucosamine-1-phosphate N-acetyltransferase|nr:hypothetical protein [Phycisphaerales bacterium]
MPDAIIFDDGLGKLGALTDLRAAFDLRTGAWTSAWRLRRLLDLNVLGLVTPGAGAAGDSRAATRAAALATVTSEYHAYAKQIARAADALLSIPAGTLVINGRCVLPPEEIGRLELGQALVEKVTGHVIAARFTKAEHYVEFFKSFSASVAPWTISVERRVMLSRPWHIRTFRDQALTQDLLDIAAGGESSSEIPEGVTVIGDAPLLIRDDHGAKVYPGVIIDVEHGPVVIDEHATVRPGAVLIGPLYVGRHATVLDKALIKSNTSIGPWCKVAGEVGGTIFQGYANKAHDGHLGDSYVGQWANLGAGTTNSNLLNTYGEVTMRATAQDSLERTGEQFMGAIIGDHVKTAICTRIMTGATLHTGAMIAMTAAVSGNVPPFAWCTDEHPPGTKTFRLDKFLDIARTVMGRRKLTMSEAYAALVGAVHGG